MLQNKWQPSCCSSCREKLKSTFLFKSRDKDEGGWSGCSRRGCRSRGVFVWQHRFGKKVNILSHMHYSYYVFIVNCFPLLDGVNRPCRSVKTCSSTDTPMAQAWLKPLTYQVTPFHSSPAPPLNSSQLTLPLSQEETNIVLVEKYWHPGQALFIVYFRRRKTPATIGIERLHIVGMMARVIDNPGGDIWQQQHPTSCWKLTLMFIASWFLQLVRSATNENQNKKESCGDSKLICWLKLKLSGTFPVVCVCVLQWSSLLPLVPRNTPFCWHPSLYTNRTDICKEKKKIEHNFLT